MRRLPVYIFVFTLIIAATGCDVKQNQPGQSLHGKHGEKHNYERFISLSPSTTEILFALGLGDRIVGVTRFCNYPPEAREKVNVGGYFDPNNEVIAALEPDLVLVLPGHDKVRDHLNELKLHYVTIRNERVSDILEAIIIIGDTCEVRDKAKELVVNIRNTMDDIRKKTEGYPRPKVLISINRAMGTGTLHEVYIAGRDTYYDELINLAGGVNVYEGNAVEYPVLSAEGILHLNPDIIIDLVPESDNDKINEVMIVKEWESLSHINAVKNRRVYILHGDYVVIPGPRFIKLLADLARVIHPEIKWD
ncbi:MAG: ABC transporter substrate-binding protein [Candidatus Latescibacteria bacterium]|nr:ABC transporter substrate-binding protein [Candidatus Latescibacterota bacterium]